jgi:hypothetical protein
VTRTLLTTLLTVVSLSGMLATQQAPAPTGFSPGIELPVTLRQNVIAGKTAVGAKVQAKLAVATLIGGAVVPQGAILSGEVLESVAKSATAASQLSIRMDLAQWKSGSVPIKAYLTAWYYPVAAPVRALSDDPPATRSPVRWNGSGAHQESRFPPSQPAPGTDPDVDIDKDRERDRDREKGSTSRAPGSNISQHRVLMKDVESSRKQNNNKNNQDGSITLTSTRGNIKLDKQTTYVLATGDLTAGPS